MILAKRLRRLSERLRDRIWLLRLQVASSGRIERAADGMPVPPAHLIFLVAGRPDTAWFLTAGKRGAEVLRDILRSNGIALENFESILDFGCGVGRVLRHLPSLTNAKLFGCDYNGKLIAWCRKNLAWAEFSVNQRVAKLQYDDNMFDFIYALSIFTHMTPVQHRFWIGELGRVLRPEGYLLLTTHGQFYESHVPENLKADFRAGKLVVRNTDRAGENHCAAFHPEKYVREELARGWEVVDFVEQGALGNPSQDVYLLRKPSPTA